MSPRALVDKAKTKVDVGMMIHTFMIHTKSCSPHQANQLPHFDLMHPPLSQFLASGGTLMEGAEFRGADVFQDGVEIRLALGGDSALSIGDTNRQDP